MSHLVDIERRLQTDVPQTQAFVESELLTSAEDDNKPA